jgi:hypothetical protein
MVELAKRAGQAKLLEEIRAEDLREEAAVVGHQLGHDDLDFVEGGRLDREWHPQAPNRWFRLHDSSPPTAQAPAPAPEEYSIAVAASRVQRDTQSLRAGRRCAPDDKG